MKRDLVHEKQPFGNVEEHPMHPNTMANGSLHHNKPGADTEVGCNSHDHGPAIHDITVQARNRASAHVNEPFHWTGRPKK